VTKDKNAIVNCHMRVVVARFQRFSSFSRFLGLRPVGFDLFGRFQRALEIELLRGHCGGQFSADNAFESQEPG
jgi:hypothetical protein